MAISVLIEADEYRPIYHDIFYRLDSTNKNETNFKYVFKINVGATERKVKVSPEPVNGYGELNISQHLQDFIDQETFDIDQPGRQDAPRANYTLKIDEEYVDGGGNFVVNVDEHVFALKNGYNTIFSRTELFSGLAKFRIGTAFKDLLLNIPLNTKVAKDDVLFIHYLREDTPIAPTIEMRLEEFSQAGSVAINTIPITGKTDSQLLKVDLFTIPFNAATIRFELSIKDAATSTKYTKVHSYRLFDRCTVRTPIKLIYLDSKGSYASLNFDGASRERIGIKSKTFRKAISPPDDKLVKRGVQRYYSEANEVLTLNTQIADENANIMHEDLLRSNRVFYVTAGNKNFIPVEVLSNTFAPKKGENSELPQYTFDIRFAYEQITR